jgi:hypothetical protein
MAFLCISQQGTRGDQKRHKKRFGKNPCQKLLASANMVAGAAHAVLVVDEAAAAPGA